MQKMNTNWFRSLLSSKVPGLARVTGAIGQPEQVSQLPNALGIDLNGQVVENPLLDGGRHCLVLGATGTGKTTLARELVRNTSFRLIWVEGGHADLDVLKQVIESQERFDHPVLVVVDDAHLHTEQLELIELIARDGVKSNVLLLITAQLLSDLPQAVWRNCQIKFAIGEDAREQLQLSGEPLAAFETSFSWPSRQGRLQISMPNQFQVPEQEMTGNPLIRRASTPQLAPYEESSLARQIPSAQWSKEELAELPDLRGRQLGSKDLPHRTRYSRTL
jgi:Cdc6-like AAA superfamily ATPase